tara:strand:- start:1372 stop:1551 length:180 start_codon:yes stop_codon:yes gene_type:complete
MKVLKQFYGEDDWEEISLDKALELLQGGYKKETIIPMLKDGAVLRGISSSFKLLKEENE